MTEKRALILSKAKELFINLGYHKTNMQRLADECGISKGAVYLTFKSKDEIFFALLRQMSDQLFRSLDDVDTLTGLSPRDKFCKKLMLLMTITDDQRKLNDLIYSEQISFSAEFQAQIVNKRKRMEQSQQIMLLECYGEAIQPYIQELSMMTNGLMYEFMTYQMFERHDYSPSVLVDRIAFALDQIVSGLLTDQPSPLMATAPIITTSDRMRGLIGTLSKHVSALINIESTERERLNKTILLLEHCLQSDPLDTSLATALLAGLRGYKTLEESRRYLADLYQLSLL